MKRTGFSLIEGLIIVLIIAVLAVIGTYVYTKRSSHSTTPISTQTTTPATSSTGQIQNTSDLQTQADNLAQDPNLQQLNDDNTQLNRDLADF